MMARLQQTALFTSLIFLLCWPSYLFVSVAGKGVNPFTVSTILMFIYATGAFLTVPRIQTRTIACMRKSPTAVIVFISFWSWNVVAAIFGRSPGTSLSDVVEGYIFYGSWTWITIVFLSQENGSTIFRRAIGISIVVATVAGLAEFTTGIPIFRLLKLENMAAGNQEMLDQISTTYVRDGVARVQANYANAISYGVIVGSFLPVAIGALFMRGRNTKLSALFLIPAIIFNVWLASTRAAQAGVLAGVIVFALLILLNPRRWYSLVFTVMLVATAGVLAPSVVDQVAPLVEGRTKAEVVSSNARSQQYEKAGFALDARPISGYGAGNAQDIAGTRDHANTTSLDSYFLVVAVDTGYVGLALFILMIATSSLGGWLATFGTVSGEDRMMLCAVIATTTCLTIGLSIAALRDFLPLFYATIGFLIARRATVRRQNAVSI
jgi:hypothetical protein